MQSHYSTGGREIFQRDIQQESINTTQNVTVPADVEDQETSDYPNASEVLPNVQHSYTEIFYIVRKVHVRLLLDAGEYGKYPRASEFRNSSR